MIAYLHGNVIYRDAEKSLIILEVNGVGYEVYVPMLNFSGASFYGSGADAKGNADGGNKLSLFIYTYVREDRITLYGFNGTLERDIFSLLLDVKDVGPKLAVTILSKINAANFINVLTMQDVSALCSIKGIGQSKAERIIMELKNKILKKVSVYNDINANELHVNTPETVKYDPTEDVNENSGDNKSISKGNGKNSNGSSKSSSSNGSGKTEKSGDKNKAGGVKTAEKKQPSDIIMESALALEALGYSRIDSFNTASKVFGISKEEGAIPSDTEDLMRECLKYIYSQKKL
ncbi:MAG: Holliday junction branch migration protein RuvA [Candidatus Acidulodesulfobacterium sp.]